LKSGSIGIIKGAIEWITATSALKKKKKTAVITLNARKHELLEQVSGGPLCGH
jgi:hypothetical protein